MGKYDDIINLPAFEPKYHPRMSMRDRAGQFAPFAALSGSGASIEEAGRSVDSRIVLDEDAKNLLDAHLRYLSAEPEEPKTVTVTHFVPDGRKAGGSYVDSTGVFMNTDPVKRTLRFGDGREIPIDNIIAITGDFPE